MSILLTKVIFSKVGIAFLLSGAIVATPIAYNYYGAGGYRGLKEAVKNTVKADSLTMKANLVLKDSKMGQVTVDATAKTDIKNEQINSNATANTGAGKIDVTAISQGNELVIKSNIPDLNRSVPIKDKFQMFKSARNDINFAQEFAFELIIADIKRKITEKPAANGESEYTLKVKGDELQTLVNSVIGKINPDYEIQIDQVLYDSLVKEQMSLLLGADASTLNIPVLEKDIKINEIEIKATSDSNKLLTSLLLDLKTSGKDKSDTVHQQEVVLNTLISDVNQTKVK